MTYEVFLALDDNAADGLPPALAALALDRAGHWDEAHERASEVEASDTNRVHAYLHRKEGDVSNALLVRARRRADAGTVAGRRVASPGSPAACNNRCGRNAISHDGAKRRVIHVIELRSLSARLKEGALQPKPPLRSGLRSFTKGNRVEAAKHQAYIARARCLIAWAP